MIKKFITIILISLLCNNSNTFAMFCSSKNKKTTFEKLPLINAISEYGEYGTEVTERGAIKKNNMFLALFLGKFSIYPFETKKINKDVQEFNETFTGSINLWNYCSTLNKRRNKLETLSTKENALLQFAYSMTHHEAEWKKWHTCEGRSDGEKIDKNTKKGPLHFFEDKEILRDKRKVIRMDVNSPYYQHGNFGNDTDKAPLFHTLNTFENQAFHDELKFLTTQLNKVKLYWGIKPETEKTSEAYHDYKKTKSLLEKEIESFLKPANRKTFTHSCMKQKDFELVQKMRDAYNNE